MSNFDSRPSLSRLLAWVDTQEPVSVQDVKAQARFVFDNENALIERCIAAARARCEGDINRRIRRVRMELTFDAWGTGLRLDRMGHEVSVTSIVYRDISGEMQNWPASQYRIAKGQILRIVPGAGLDFPALNQNIPEIAVTLEAGWANAELVPEPLRHWIIATAASMFRNRESHCEKPMTELEFIGGLLDEYRVSVL